MQDKIKELMEREGLSTSRFAELLGVQPSGVSHIVSGRNKPSFELLQRILRRFPKINPDWLLLDSVQMYRDGATSYGAFVHGNLSQSEPKVEERSAEPTPILDMFVESVVDGVTPHHMEVTALPHDYEPSQTAKSIEREAAQSAPVKDSGASVERVILLYDDGTFVSYKTKR